jgi:dsDNA-specific endonuclease/ATPase MutS2
MGQSPKGSSLPTLDLHGERLDGLDDKVDRFITTSQAKGHHQVRMMTGKGSGQVRAAVQKYLKLGGYPSQFERLANGTPNEGVLVVQI